MAQRKPHITVHWHRPGWIVRIGPGGSPEAKRKDVLFIGVRPGGASRAFRNLWAVYDFLKGAEHAQV